MDRAKLKPFKELQNSKLLYRLDWFGGIFNNFSEEDNSLIECYFTPFIESPSKHQNGETVLSHSIKDQIPLGIAIGYLPSLHLGQFYKSGQITQPPPNRKYETITFELNTADISAITDTYLPALKLESHSDLIAYKYKKSAEKSGIKELNGVLLKTNNSKLPKKYSTTPSPMKVYIHEMELIRAYLTNSSHSCKKLFSGAFADNKLCTDVVNTIHEDFRYS